MEKNRFSMTASVPNNGYRWEPCKAMTLQAAKKEAVRKYKELGPDYTLHIAVVEGFVRTSIAYKRNETDAPWVYYNKNAESVK